MNTSLTSEKKKHIFLFFFIFLNIFFIGVNSSHALSESDMQNPTLLTNEGFTYLSRGGSQNYEKAEEYFRQALKLNKHHADAYVEPVEKVFFRVQNACQ